MADVVSGYFVPVVVIIAIIAAISWFIGTKDLKFALTIFISVLVVACPCAPLWLVQEKVLKMES